MNRCDYGTYQLGNAVDLGIKGRMLKKDDIYARATLLHTGRVICLAGHRCGRAGRATSGLRYG